MGHSPMRLAERNKYWSALRDKPTRPVQLASFSFEGIPGIEDGSIEFRSPMTAICGVNGTGKSSLLRGIWATLKWSSLEQTPEIKERLKELSGKLSFKIGNTVVDHEVPRASAGVPETIACVHIDPSSMATPLQRRVCAITNLQEVLEPHSPIQLEEDEVSIISFVLNKRYDSVAIYEIDDFADEDPFPIVTVAKSGANYDSRTMSLGEISVFLIFWLLRRVEENSLILLEEPETFLAPVSQGALLDYLAALCVRRRLTLVLTTHSPQMFARLSKEQVQFCYRSVSGPAKLAKDEQFYNMRRAVGIEPQVDVLLIVEDRLAREFLLSILKSNNVITLTRSEIIDVGGFGNIDLACSLLAKKLRAITIVAAYDGDTQTSRAIDWPAVFLPGERPLEELLREAAENDLGGFALRLGKTVDEVDIELTRIKALDHHDWYIELGKLSRMSYTDLLNILSLHWASDAHHEADVDNFVFDLEKILTGLRQTA